MSDIIGVITDARHYFNPHKIPEKHENASVWERIGGIALLILSTLTLGIATGLFIHWANRKVSKIEERDAQYTVKKMADVFGEKVSGAEKTEEEDLIAEAMKSIQTGRTEKLLKQLETLKDKEWHDIDVQNALLETAVRYERVELVSVLFKKIIEWNNWSEAYEANGHKIDCLLFLPKARSVKMVKKLLDLGANPMLEVDDDGANLFHYLRSKEIGEYLLKYSEENESFGNYLSNHDFRYNDYDDTPLHYSRSPEVAKFLLDNFEDLDVNAQNSDGRTALFTALFTVDPKVREFLISRGADVNAQDNHGNTPLHVVDDINAVKLLVDNGADINMKNHYGATPLILALMDQDDVCYETIRTMVEDLGADVTIEDDDLKTALHYCKDGKIAELLIANGADVDSIHLHEVCENREVLEALLKAGADPNKQDSGTYPIFWVRDVETDIC